MNALSVTICTVNVTKDIWHIKWPFVGRSKVCLHNKVLTAEFKVNGNRSEKESSQSQSSTGTNNKKGKKSAKK